MAKQRLELGTKDDAVWGTAVKQRLYAEPVAAEGQPPFALLPDGKRVNTIQLFKCINAPFKKGVQ